METIETRIERFNEGVVNDPRSKRPGVAQMIVNFDIFTDPHRMIPQRDSESGDSSATTSQKQAFVVALRSTTYRLFSLGVKSGAATAEVLYKDLTTGSSNDLDDATWATPSNNQSSAGATSFNLFVYYKKTALIYGARAGSHIWAFDPSSSAAWADTHQALTYTNIAQGVVHPKDDILYVPYDNKIAKNDNGSWTTSALTLPEHLYVTSIEPRGNYLFIACAPLSGIGNSVGFYWDRDTSLATLSESVDLGPGVVKIAAEVDGELLTVSLAGGDSTRFKHRVIFRRVDGSRATKFMELTSTTSPTVLINKQVVDNRLYFLMSGTFNGSVRSGLWAIGRPSPLEPFAIALDRTQNNDTALGSGALKGFYVLGDYAFISYTTTSGDYALSKTNDQESYTATSIWERKFATKGSNQTKNLITATVTHEPLPSSGQVVLKTKKNAQTSYGTIYTLTTDDEISYDGTKVDDASFGDHKERDFRIESTGGAVITGFVFEEEIKDSDK